MSAILRRRARPAIAALVLGLAVTAAPFIHIRGWDWTAGTATSYCGVYLPHWDFYCQSGR